MKIKKIAYSPSWGYYNSSKGHYSKSDPINIWMTNETFIENPFERKEEYKEDDPWDDDDYDFDASIREEYGIQIFLSEVKIVTDVSEEIFCSKESHSNISETTRSLSHFSKNIETYTLKKLNYIRNIYELSICFTKEYMKDLIYNGQDDLEDEQLIKQFLEADLWYINSLIVIENNRIKNTLDEYDL